MFGTAVLLVICSGLLHSVWNFMTKISLNKNVFLLSISIVSAVCLLPFLLIEVVSTKIPPLGYGLIAASLGLQGGYAWLMSRAYSNGDISLVYPIMRGTGVVFIPLISVLFLGERISLLGWMGIGLIVGGIIFMNINFSSWRTLNKGVFFAFMVGLIITSYSIVDKLLLAYLSPIALLQISNMGFALPLIPSIFKTNDWTIVIKKNWRLLFWGALLSPGSYFLYLLALKIAPISHIAPLRECGTVFGALLGVAILKEKHALQRMTAAAIVTAGILVVGFIV